MATKSNTAPDPETVEIAPDEELKQPDAVLILKIAEGDQIRTEVTPLGDVQPTEVQTLIELGIQSWRAKIGLKV